MNINLVSKENKYAPDVILLLLLLFLETQVVKFMNEK